MGSSLHQTERSISEAISEAPDRGLVEGTSEPGFLARFARCFRGRAWVLAMVVVAGFFGAPGVAGAQEEPEPEEARGQGNTAPPAVHKEGEYGGVVKPGDSPFKAPKRRNVLSWIGFQPQEGGGSRLFIQLSNEVTYSQAVDKGVLLVHLDGVRYRNRNTRRRLDMRFFNSALMLVTSKSVGKRRAGKAGPARSAGIDVRVEFKNAADARPGTATMRAEKDGYTYLILDFGAGTDAGTSEGGGSISVSDPEG